MLLSLYTYKESKEIHYNDRKQQTVYAIKQSTMTGHKLAAILKVRLPLD